MRDSSQRAGHAWPPTGPVVVGRITSETELLTFTINDRAEKLLANNVFRTEVALTRAEEPVRIVAIDRQGRRSTVEFVLARTAARPGAGVRRRGTVGLPRAGAACRSVPTTRSSSATTTYRLLRPLKTAVADAREVARVLEQDYGFQVRLLVNATRYDMLAALNDLREKLTDKDNLLIYYAGHGELDERNQRGHWLPIDAEPNSTANWISNVAITDVLNAMTVQQLLVVADSCYAGTLTRSSLGRLEGGLSEAERLRLLSVMANQRSRMVLTSGGVEPVLDSGGRRPLGLRPGLPGGSCTPTWACCRARSCSAISGCGWRPSPTGSRCGRSRSTRRSSSPATSPAISCSSARTDPTPGPPGSAGGTDCLIAGPRLCDNPSPRLTIPLEGMDPR